MIYSRLTIFFIQCFVYAIPLLSCCKLSYNMPFAIVLFPLYLKVFSLLLLYCLCHLIFTILTTMCLGDALSEFIFKYILETWICAIASL